MQTTKWNDSSVLWPLLGTLGFTVIVAAANIAIVPWPKSERPPGVYSFVTGLPKADRIEPQFKNDDRLPVRRVKTVSYRFDPPVPKPKPKKKRGKRYAAR